MFLIPVTAILAMFVLYQWSNRFRFGATSFLITVYMCMGASAILFYVFFGQDTAFDVEAEPMLYLSLCLCIAFYGLFSYSDHRIRFLAIENVILLRWLERFQIVTSLGAMVYFLPFAVEALSGSIVDNRLNLEFLQEELGAYGLANSMFSLVGNLFVLSIVCALINLSSLGRGGTRRRAMMLLGSSTVYIVYVLAYVGRDGFVYWTMTFVFCYLMLKDFIPIGERSRIKVFAVVLAIPAFIAFLLIGIARFSGERYSVLASILEYAGSQIFYFNDHYLLDAPPMMGLVNFSQFLELGARLLSEEIQILDRIQWFRDFTDAGVVPWVFTTFIGSFLLDFRQWGTLLAVVLLAVSTRLVLRRPSKAGVFSLSRLLAFVVLSQVVLWGVFYFRHYTMGYYLIVMVLTALAFKVFRRNRQVLILAKQS